MKPPLHSLDPRERALEKASARAADARALASGEKSRQQLRIENGAFAIPRDRVRVEYRGRKF